MYLMLLCTLLLSAPAEDRPTVIVVAGAEGTSEFGRTFQAWTARWAEAAKQGDARFVLIGQDETSADGPTDKQRLQSVLEQELKTKTQPLWLVFIGHGTHDGREAKFNLRGPDVSDEELAEWLGLARRPLAVFHCASASAPFLSRLSGKGRVVVTATRSGGETSFARFGDYFSAAITDPAADLDKDGQTSLLEAFLAASHRVEEFYKQEGRLPSEHALLDDNGDSQGVGADWFEGIRLKRTAKSGALPDGAAAHQWYLVLSEEEQGLPAAIRQRRDKLELQIAALREKKAAMAEEEYYSRLEKLLLELGRLYAEQSEEGLEVSD